MIKRISCLFLCLLLICSIWAQQVIAAGNEVEVPATTDHIPVEEQSAEEQTVEEQAVEAESVVPALYVDGKIVERSGLLYREGIPYVSIRYVASAFCPDAVVTWTGEYATITTDKLSIVVHPDHNYVIANDRYLYMPEGAVLKSGVLRIPAEMIARIFCAEYSLDSETMNVFLTSGTETLVSGDEFYDKDDLYWLSHIIYAESGNQPLEGKIAVGNVVMNRAANPIFPNSIYGVIFQKNQFSPVKNGTINLTPNEESVLAAKLCLDGAVVLSDALWFNSASRSSWASKHKTYITTIGGHAFYA